MPYTNKSHSDGANSAILHASQQQAENASREAPTSGTPRLLDQIRDKIRLRHYSIRTEQSYLGWVRRFILFHNKKHPKDMGAAEN